MVPVIHTSLSLDDTINMVKYNFSREKEKGQNFSYFLQTKIYRIMSQYQAELCEISRRGRRPRSRSRRVPGVWGLGAGFA